MALANAGEWDTISDEAEFFSRELGGDWVHDIGPHSQETLAAIAHLLETLANATAICEERKSQIAPLMAAFDRIEQARAAAYGKP